MLMLNMKNKLNYSHKLKNNIKTLYKHGINRLIN